MSRALKNFKKHFYKNINFAKKNKENLSLLNELSS